MEGGRREWVSEWVGNAYKGVFLGMGPANLGIVVNAFLQNEVESFLLGDLAFIEQAGEAGRGSLGSYNITANSLGSVFFECVEQLGLVDVFENMDSYRELARYKNVPPPLKVIGKFQSDLSDYFIKELQRKGRADVFLRHEVSRIRMTSSGQYEVHFNPLGIASARPKALLAQMVCMNMGGVQELEHTLDQEIVYGLSLKRYAGKVLLSDGVLRLSDRELLERLGEFGGKRTKRVVVVGGSHSAFSIGRRIYELWKHSRGDMERLEVCISSRRSPRLYSTSEADAKAHGLCFTNQDLCPVTGRVHRFGGLRYAAGDFALQVLKGETNSASSNCTVEFKLFENCTPGKKEDLESLLDQADLLIACYGYRARTVPISDQNGMDVELAHAFDGGLQTDGFARVYDKAGRILPGLYSFGLGSGMQVSPTIGGELSYTGRVDGVWLYQNDVGSILLKEVLALNASRNQKKS